MPGLFPNETPISLDFSNINVGFRLDSMGIRVNKIYLTCQSGLRRNKWKHIIYDRTQIVESIPTTDTNKTQIGTGQNIRVKAEKTKAKGQKQ